MVLLKHLAKSLPHPFQNAVGIQITSDGGVHLVDQSGKSLVMIPLGMAFELSPSRQDAPAFFGYGFSSWLGYGHTLGYGVAMTDGCGNGEGDYGSGREPA